MASISYRREILIWLNTTKATELCHPATFILIKNVLTDMLDGYLTQRLGEINKILCQQVWRMLAPLGTIYQSVSMNKESMY